MRGRSSRARRRTVQGGAGLLAALLVSTALTAAPSPAARAAAPAPQLAQAAPATRAFDIPAQPLADAVNAFGRQAGLQITAEAGVTAGVQAQAVTGTFAAEEALRRLLAGTGVTWRFTEANAVVLTKLPQLGEAGDIQLGPVRVEGTGVSGDPGRTEGSGSYTTRAANTSTRLPLSLRETPQTVTVVTRKQMDDFTTTNIDEVVRMTSGVVIDDRGDNGSNHYSRGFAMQSQYDGMVNPIGIGHGARMPSPDSAFLDHVEVLQGAAGLLTGAGEPGGTINLMRKRPTGEFQGLLEAQFGSWDRKRVVGDLSGPLAAAGAIRGRVVGVWDDGDQFADYAFVNRKAVYAVVDVDIGSSTTLNGSIQIQDNRERNQLGIPTAPDGSSLGLSRRSFFARADAITNKEQYLYTVGIEHRFDSGWLLKSSATHTYNDFSQREASFVSAAGGRLDVATGDGLVLRHNRGLLKKSKADALDIYTAGPVGLFGRSHEFVFGANASRDEGRVRISNQTATPFNLYSFDPTSFPPSTGTQNPWGGKSKTSQQGLYGVSRWSVAEPLTIIVGARASWYDYEDSGVQQRKESGVISPYAGVVYDVNETVSLYAGYSDIFQPQTFLNASGSILDPVAGKNYEAGLKGEFLSGALNASAAIFRLEQVNLPLADISITPDPNNICRGTCYIAADKVRSEGVDLSLYGEVLPGWNIAAGYTYVDATYATGAREGQRYRTQHPKNSFRISTSYQHPGSRVALGASVRAQSRIYYSAFLSGINYTVSQSAYAVVGLLARYDIRDDTTAQLNVENVFDQKYYNQVLSPISGTFFGEPRKVSLNLKYKF